MSCSCERNSSRIVSILMEPVVDAGDVDTLCCSLGQAGVTLADECWGVCSVAELWVWCLMRLEGPGDWPYSGVLGSIPSLTLGVWLGVALAIVIELGSS